MTKQEKVIKCCRTLWKVSEYGRIRKKTMEYIRTKKTLGKIWKNLEEDNGIYWNKEEFRKR